MNKAAIAACAVVGIACLLPAATGGPAPEPLDSQHVALELTDGSRLVGHAQIATVRLIAPYGRLDLAFEHVGVIEFDADGERGRLRMINGDLLSGVLDVPEIVLTTPAGRQVVRRATMARLVRIPAEAAHLAGRLVHGKVEGERTDFVKALADADAAKLKKVTRTLETFSSDHPQRHRAGPWLYPVDGKGEIPRVLYEDAAIYYPIWGTWRQRWADGWVHKDENGAHVDGPKSRHPHYESAVDYYVVPLVSGGTALNRLSLGQACRPEDGTPARPH